MTIIDKGTGTEHLCGVTDAFRSRFELNLLHDELVSRSLHEASSNLVRSS